MGRHPRYTERELKTLLEILDTAKVTEYATIRVEGFSVTQLERALVNLKAIAATSWYVEARRNET